MGKIRKRNSLGGGPGTDRSGERRANKELSERQIRRERAGFRGSGVGSEEGARREKWQETERALSGCAQ